MKNLPLSSAAYDLSRYGFEPRLPERFDSTALQDYVDCPSAFYLRHVLGLRPKGPEPAHFVWGGRWHQAMFVLHSEWDLGAALEVATSDWPSYMDSEEPKGRTIDRMTKLLVQYCEKYAMLDQQEWRTVRREMFFDVECLEDNPNCPLGGCGLRWCGRMDGIFERIFNGKFFVRDYKTTTFFRQSTWTQLKHGFQIPGYVWAAMHLMPTQVVGAYIDLLYLKKASEDFHRKEIRYTLPDVIEWRDNVKQIIGEIRDRFDKWPDEPHKWTQDRNHCERLWPCAFVPVHYTPDIRDTRLMIMQQDYTIDRWDPSSIYDD